MKYNQICLYHFILIYKIQIKSYLYTKKDVDYSQKLLTLIFHLISDCASCCVVALGIVIIAVFCLNVFCIQGRMYDMTFLPPWLSPAVHRSGPYFEVFTLIQQSSFCSKSLEIVVGLFLNLTGGYVQREERGDGERERGRERKKKQKEKERETLM